MTHWITNLTPYKRKIVELAASGYSNKEIAIALERSPSTVGKHLSEIYEKHGISGRENLRSEYRNYHHMQVLSPKEQQQSVDLSGLWLSRFSFVRANSSETTEVQFNIEMLSKSGIEDSYTGFCVCSASTMDRVYSHTLSITERYSMVVGIWENENTSHMGCLQLTISQYRNTMRGMHLGHDSDLQITSGDWLWRRLTARAIDDRQPALALRPLNQLEEVISSHPLASNIPVELIIR